MQAKDKRGRFTNKSNSDRKVRSIRATNQVWDKFGEQADKQRITRADLLEEIFSHEAKDNQVIHSKIADIIGILKHGITPKKQGGLYASNSAKALKDEVIKAIALLEELTE